MNLNTEDNFFYINKNLNNKKKYKKNVIENFVSVRNAKKAGNLVDAASEVDIGKFRKVLGDMDFLDEDVLKKLDNDQLLKLHKKLDLKTKTVKKTVSDGDVQLNQKQLDDIGKAIEDEYATSLKKIDKNKLQKELNVIIDDVLDGVGADNARKNLENVINSMSKADLERMNKNIIVTFKKIKQKGINNFTAKKDIDDFILANTLEFDLDTNKKFKNYINNVEVMYKKTFCKKNLYCSINPEKLRKTFGDEIFDDYLLAQKLRRRFYRLTKPGLFEQFWMAKPWYKALIVSLVLVAGVSIAYATAAVSLSNQGCKDNAFCQDLSEATGETYICVKREEMPDGTCTAICESDGNCKNGKKCNLDTKTCELPCDLSKNNCSEGYECIQSLTTYEPTDKSKENFSEVAEPKRISFCKASCENKNGGSDQGNCNKKGLNGYKCTVINNGKGENKNVCMVGKQTPSKFPCLEGEAFLGIDILSSTGLSCKKQNLIIISSLVIFILVIMFFVLKIIF